MLFRYYHNSAMQTVLTVGFKDINMITFKKNNTICQSLFSKHPNQSADSIALDSSCLLFEARIISCFFFLFNLSTFGTVLI